MAGITPRTDTVIIFQGDDFEEFKAREKAVTDAATAALAGGAKRYADADDLGEAVRAHDAFIDEAKGRGFQVAVQARKKAKWREMVNAHPPREENEGDHRWGFNYDTLADALVPASVTGIVGPEGPVNQIEDFLDDLCDADFSAIYSACVRLNQGEGPKGPISSALGLTSA